MYKFEISADSLKHLESKIEDFVRDYPETKPQYIDDIQTSFQVAEAMRINSEPAEIASVKAVENPDYENWKQSTNIPANAIVLPLTASLVSSPTELDARGLPWDSRIHSGSQQKAGKGVWKRKKGVEDKLIEQVEAELRGNASFRTARATTIELPAPFVAPTPPAPSVVVETPVFVASQPTPIVTPVQVAPVEVKQTYENIPLPTSTRPVHSYVTFKTNLTKIFADLVNENKITREYIQDLLKYFEIQEIWNFLGSEKKCQELYELFAQYGFITKVD